MSGMNGKCAPRSEMFNVDLFIDQLAVFNFTETKNQPHTKKRTTLKQVHRTFIHSMQFCALFAFYL